MHISEVKARLRRMQTYEPWLWSDKAVRGLPAQPPLPKVRTPVVSHRPRTAISCTLCYCLPESQEKSPGAMWASVRQVALLFLARGAMPLEPAWREFLEAAALIEPVHPERYASMCEPGRPPLQLPLSYTRVC